MSSSPAEFSIAPPLEADPFRDRRPPYSEDAEQAVLAAMLLDADAVVRVAELLDESMFYREAHRKLFRAATALHQAGAVLDPVTLAEELDRQGALAPAGGREYIGELLYAVPTAANVEYHARIVKEKALRRRLIEVAQGLVVEAHESTADAGALIDLAEHRIFQVSQQRGGEGFMRIKELLWPAMERIEQLREGGPVTGVPSGFADLDKITLGFQPSDLVIVAARPSMGKTALVLNIAQYAAVEGNVPTAIFSLEMSKESLVQRMLASEGFIDAQRLRSGRLTSQDHSNLAKAAALRASPAPSITKKTGSPRSLAISAVLPSSETGLRPSKRPMTPSTKTKSTPREFLSKQSWMPSFERKNRSRFLDFRGVDIW